MYAVTKPMSGKSKKKRASVLGRGTNVVSYLRYQYVEDRHVQSLAYVKKQSSIQDITT